MNHTHTNNTSTHTHTLQSFPPPFSCSYFGGSNPSFLYNSAVDGALDLGLSARGANDVADGTLSGAEPSDIAILECGRAITLGVVIGLKWWWCCGWWWCIGCCSLLSPPVVVFVTGLVILFVIDGAGFEVDGVAGSWPVLKHYVIWVKLTVPTPTETIVTITATDNL